MTTPVHAQPLEPSANIVLIEQITQAFERRDIEAVTPFIAEDATIVQPMTFSGSVTPDFALSGNEAVLGYFQQVFSTMGRIQFDNERLSETRDGRSVYYEANGDFTTVDGRPYRNVYLFRFDIEDGQIVHIAEYANPVIFTQTFGAPEIQ